MKSILLIIIAFFSLPLHATSGEPSYIKSIYYDKSNNSVFYIFDWGYGESIFRIPVSTGVQELLADNESDNPEALDAFEELRQTITQHHLPLNEFKISKVGLSFQTKPKSIIRRTGGESYEAEHLNSDLFGEIIEWEIKALHKEKIVGNGKFREGVQNSVSVTPHSAMCPSSRPSK